MNRQTQKPWSTVNPEDVEVMHSWAPWSWPKVKSAFPTSKKRSRKKLINETNIFDLNLKVPARDNWDQLIYARGDLYSDKNDVVVDFDKKDAVDAHSSRLIAEASLWLMIQTKTSRCFSFLHCHLPTCLRLFIPHSSATDCSLLQSAPSILPVDKVLWPSHTRRPWQPLKNLR